MSIIKGLSSITSHIEAEEKRMSGDTVKTQWFGLKDKEAAKVIFLQELDPDSENFSEKNDLGFIAVEHSNPDDFRRKALCSMDDGSCWACEKNRETGWKAGWKQKQRLYINVLVVDDNGNEEVKVLSQGLSAKQITPALIEQAGEIGTITDKYFKIKRAGAGFNDTSYILTPLGAHDKNVEDYDLFELDKVVRSVPYDQQEAHYMTGVEVSGDEGAAETEGRTAPVASDEW